MGFYWLIFSGLVSKRGELFQYLKTAQNIYLNNMKNKKGGFNWLIKAPTCTIIEQLLLSQKLNFTVFFFFTLEMLYHSLLVEWYTSRTSSSFLILLKLTICISYKNKIFLVSYITYKMWKKIFILGLTFLECPSNMPILSSLFLFCALEITSILIPSHIIPRQMVCKWFPSFSYILKINLSMFPPSQIKRIISSAPKLSSILIFLYLGFSYHLSSLNTQKVFLNPFPLSSVLIFNLSMLGTLPQACFSLAGGSWWKVDT